MNLYYLENKLAGKSYQQHKYYTGCGDMERDAGSDNLSDASFFLQKEDAEDSIKSANDWWEKHDYEVKSIDIEALIAQGKSHLNLQLILPERKKPKKVAKKEEATRKITVIIEGTDGVGKSTVIKALEQYFGNHAITEYKQTDKKPVKLEFEFLDRETTTISASMLFTVRMMDRVERIKKYMDANPDTFILFLVNEDAEELMRRIKTRDKPISDFDNDAPAYNLMYMATYREMERQKYVNHQIGMLDVTGDGIKEETNSAIRAVKDMLTNRALNTMSLIQF
jgi:thymidylate kinase